MTVPQITDSPPGQGQGGVEQKLSDPVPTSTQDPKPKEVFWVLYNRKAEEYNQRVFKGLSSDLDTLLIFAGLFSAVTTAFIALALDLLKPDPNTDTNALLLVLITQIANPSVAQVPIDPSPPFIPTLHSILANSFFIASLSCSILAAFGAVLGKQWIWNANQPITGLSTRGHALERQNRLTAGERWHLHGVLESLPVVLQISLFTFWAGLVFYLWNQAKPVAYTAIGFAVGGAACYLYFLVASLWDPYCPFQTPFTRRLARIPLRRRHLLRIYFIFTSTIHALLRSALHISKLIWITLRSTYDAATTRKVDGFFEKCATEWNNLLNEVQGFARGPRWRPVPETGEDGVDDTRPRTPGTGPIGETECVRWLLGQVQDQETVLLEAARKLPEIHSLEPVRRLTQRSRVFHRLVSQLRKGILHFSGSTNRHLSPMRGLIDFKTHVTTYATAISHMLLTNPPNPFQPGVLNNLLSEFRILNQSHSAVKEMILLEHILIVSSRGGEYAQELARADLNNIEGARWDSPPNLLSRNGDIPVLPFIYLLFSLDQSIYLADEGDLRIPFALSCSRELPARAGVSLMTWLLGMLSKGNVDGLWSAYTSDQPVWLELREAQSYVKLLGVSPSIEGLMLFIRILEAAMTLLEDDTSKSGLDFSEEIENSVEQLLDLMEDRDLLPGAEFRSEGLAICCRFLTINLFSRISRSLQDRLWSILMIKFERETRAENVTDLFDAFTDLVQHAPTIKFRSRFLLWRLPAFLMLLLESPNPVLRGQAIFDTKWVVLHWLSGPHPPSLFEQIGRSLAKCVCFNNKNNLMVFALVNNVANEAPATFLDTFLLLLYTQILDPTLMEESFGEGAHHRAICASLAAWGPLSIQLGGSAPQSQESVGRLECVSCWISEKAISAVTAMISGDVDPEYLKQDDVKRGLSSYIGYLQEHQVPKIDELVAAFSSLPL